ncbi:MAG: hypothetical protein HKN25_15765, partial [Pyrinomonadaceae bacterium]|nr:hypothetical protein [Pyrinomonadaceae bacterium]
MEPLTKFVIIPPFFRFLTGPAEKKLVKSAESYPDPNTTYPENIMNIFEDLVEELKEENLLEETVKSPKQKPNSDEVVLKEEAPSGNSKGEPAEPIGMKESVSTAPNEDFPNSSEGPPVIEAPESSKGDAVIELSNDSIVIEEASSPTEVISEEEPDEPEASPNTVLEEASDIDEEIVSAEPLTADEPENEPEEAPAVNEVAAELERRIAEAEELESAGEQNAAMDDTETEKGAELVLEEEDKLLEDDDEEDLEEEKEIYRQRVMDRVTSLQMVDHI